PQDAVPYLDRVPHGVVQLLEGFGARVVSSAPLVSRFAARWSAAEAEGHRRAARALAEIARDALTWAGRETARGAEVREVTLQQRVVEGIGRAGLVTDHPPIAAFAANSAMPHYEPHAGADRKSTRLNSSHEWISYAVFCLKKKNVELTNTLLT